MNVQQTQFHLQPQEIRASIRSQRKRKRNFAFSKQIKRSEHKEKRKTARNREGKYKYGQPNKIQKKFFGQYLLTTTPT